ncbi:MAG: metallophosphoesterase [Candidatus Moraniibacteriota bacterium]|nr:MAG: metallophosphoesterase [Candidatus Moranbacteria bacterium]
MFHFEEMTLSPKKILGNFLSESGDWEKDPSCDRFGVISDIHNDCLAARTTLEQRGILDSDGEWKKGISRIHLVFTGDNVNKDSPESETFRFLKHLKKTAPEHCEVTVLVGNHEIDLLLRSADGEKCLKKKEIKFLKNCEIVYKKGSILFLHGYPTRELLQELLVQYEENNGDVATSDWVVNQRFSEIVSTLLEERPLGIDKKETLHSCDFGSTEKHLGGLTEDQYYKEYGEEISTLLKRMGVTLVVHGHKKNISGGQRMEEYIPGVCMIDNDVALAEGSNPHHKHRIGLTEITTRPDKQIGIGCLYKKNIDSHGNIKMKYGTVSTTEGNG